MEEEEDEKRRRKEEEERLGSKNSEGGNFIPGEIKVSHFHSPILEIKESKSKEAKQFIERCSSERNNTETAISRLSLSPLTTAFHSQSRF